MRIRTATDVGAVIRERRRLLGLDQRELAERADVGRQWVVDVEKGKPRAALRLVLRTLEVLGIVLRAESVAAVPSKSELAGADVDLDRVIAAHRRSKTSRP